MLYMGKAPDSDEMQLYFHFTKDLEPKRWGRYIPGLGLLLAVHLDQGHKTKAFRPWKPLEAPGSLWTCGPWSVSGSSDNWAATVLSFQQYCFCFKL